MGLVKTIREKARTGLASICLVASFFASGCDFYQGREKVTFDMIALPFVGGGANIRHEIYKTEARQSLENEIDSNLSVVWGNAEFKLNAYGENKIPLWSYKVFAKENWGKVEIDRTEIYDEKGKLINIIQGRVPIFLPTNVNISQPGWIYYWTSSGGLVDYSEMLKLTSEDFRILKGELDSQEKKPTLKNKLK